MVILNDILYLSFTDLMQWSFTQDYLKKVCRENRQGESDNYTNIQDPTDARKVLIAYRSIPEQTRIVKNIPAEIDLLKQVNETQLTRLISFSTEAYNYFLTQPSTSKRAKEKAEQASWFIAIASTKPTAVKAIGFASKDEFCIAAIRLMGDVAKQRNWHSWKCTSLLGLRKRLKPFQQFVKGKATLAQACDSLASKKTGNDNAAKIGLEQQALLVQLYSDANAKPNFEQVWSIYTRKATEMVSLGHWGSEVLISDSAVRAYLSKPAIRQLWYEARHGYQEYRNVFEPVTQRERPTFANALWVIDGTPSHRYFMHGDKGRYFRFNIFPILDAHSWCVVGFWLSETENTEAVLGALRSACWVSGYLPHQILYDNSSAIQSFRAQEAIHKISVVAFPATAGNARSKIIENFFHLFNQDVQKFRPGYTANPFAVSINNRPNREALARMVKSHELPAAENALKQAIEDLTIWNNSPRKFLGGLSPIATYRKSIEATKHKQREFSNIIDVEAFWHLPGEHKKIRTYEEGKLKLVNTFIPQQYEFTNRGIELTIGGKLRTYDFEDANFRRLYIGQKFTVRYEGNPERWVDGQPDRLMLYQNGAPMQWLGSHLSLTPKELMPMAIADYKEGTRAKLTERMNTKKAQRAIVQQDFTKLIEKTKRNGTYTEAITANAFDKEVLIDAKAQRLDMLIQGDEYSIKNTPTPSGKPRTDLPKLDRYGDQYDAPLPVD